MVSRTANPSATTSPATTRPLRRAFRGEPGQVPLARDFVRRYLADAACPAEAAQDILVCTSELATNAVLHSRSGHPGGYFTVEIAICRQDLQSRQDGHNGRGGQWVHVAVEDAGGPWAERGTGDSCTECGRGLHIVSELSADMGITGGMSGRTAWFRSPAII
ncbi:MAG: ATP-binding protein [Nocardiopsaceae bacterium]|nr:ATP-binding protein [Nocardiopsaceae bacterium]